MQTVLLKNKKYLIFAVLIVAIGLISGLLYYNFLSDEIKNVIVKTLTSYDNFRYNYIVKDLIVMSMILILSFFVIGVPFGIFFLFYETFSIGFLINIFFSSFGFSGFVYILIYLIVNKIITLILIIIYIQKTTNIGRLIIGNLIYKNDKIIKDKLIYNFKSCLYIIIFVLAINIVLYFLSPFIFKYLSFLLN